MRIQPEVFIQLQVFSDSGCFNTTLFSVLYSTRLFASVLPFVPCSHQAVTALISASEGDLRKAIMFLQSAYRLHKDETVTPASVQEIAGVRTIYPLVRKWK